MLRRKERIQRIRKNSQTFNGPTQVSGFYETGSSNIDKKSNKKINVDNNKVLLCCIAKQENKYIGEWVTHYKNLGVDKIVIYDNNLPSYESIKNVPEIKEGIKSGLVEIKDAAGKQKYQCTAYNICYQNNKNDYEWLMFFDVDEFLVLENHKDIHDFLRQDKFKNFNSILISWKVYSDNDLLRVENDNYAVMSRFTTPSTNSGINKQSKCILRGGLSNIKFSNPHNPIVKLTCCDATGKEKVLTKARTTEIVHKGAWLNHYTTKTAQEFVDCKISRGGGANTGMQRGTKTYFFSVNKRTLEKEKILNSAKKPN